MARVVVGVSLVTLEWDRVDHLGRRRPDADVDPETVQAVHQLAVEPGDRLRLERHRERAGPTVDDPQLVLDEVEVDLEGTVTVRDR